MALATVEDVENALGGVVFTDPQASQVQYYLDFISAYIETETGVSFSVKTGEVIRMETDRYGEIDLDDFNDLTAVTSVKDVNVVAQTFTFNGLDLVCVDIPWLVVDVTLTYGMTSVPVDIAGIAIEAAKRAYAFANGLALTSKQVGDVITTYANPLDAALAFTKTDKTILDRYGVTEQTWHIQSKGRDRRDNYSVRPRNWEWL